ncbi:MAG: peptidoglycan-binding domain-containing protein [Bryobacteraceae bacterium]|nr:peptidoglycan-binding domain-containing protein [Bryobacteraceae bacterium]
MPRLFSTILVGAVLAAAPPPPNPQAAKPKAVKPTPVKPSASKPTAVKKRPIKSSRGKKTAAKRPPRQMNPSPDRYRDIQQALIDKGFLDGPATGVWDDKSIAALKRFEESQKLKMDGKIDSLSLIALGLGPKRSASALTAPSTPQP